MDNDKKTGIITFTVPHEDDGKKFLFTFTTNTEFASVCPNYANESFLDLFVNFQIPKYWHNPYGPAVSATLNGKNMVKSDFKALGLPEEEFIYALNGKQATKEQIERMNHDVTFNDEFDKIILNSND